MKVDNRYLISLSVHITGFFSAIYVGCEFLGFYPVLIKWTHRMGVNNWLFSCVNLPSILYYVCKQE